MSRGNAVGPVFDVDADGEVVPDDLDEVAGVKLWVVTLQVAGAEPELDRAACPLLEHDPDAVEFAKAGTVAARSPERMGRLVNQVKPCAVVVALHAGQLGLPMPTRAGVAPAPVANTTATAVTDAARRPNTNRSYEGQPGKFHQLRGQGRPLARAFGNDPELLGATQGFKGRARWASSNPRDQAEGRTPSASTRSGARSATRRESRTQRRGQPALRQ